MHALGPRTSLFLCLIAACSGGEPAAAPAPAVDFCATLFNKVMECGTAEERTLLGNRKETTIRGCKEIHREPEEEKAELACTLRPTCDEFRVCRRAFGVATLKREAELALKTGENFERVLKDCSDGHSSDEALNKLCVDVIKQGIGAAMKKLTEIRDAGGDGLGKCAELQRLAEKVSPEEKTAADAFCKEIEAARRAREALDAAKRHLDVGVKEVPFECDMAAEELEKLTSEWAKSKLQEVTKVCYVDLGNLILPDKVKKMLICEYQVEKVYKAAKKYGLQDATLDPWIAKAAKKCER